eukprot:1026994-Rhodomonas_salina.4
MNRIEVNQSSSPDPRILCAGHVCLVGRGRQLGVLGVRALLEGDPRHNMAGQRTPTFQSAPKLCHVRLTSLPLGLQCKHGHVMCGDCHVTTDGVCPRCNVRLDGIRNLALEK